MQNIIFNVITTLIDQDKLFICFINISSGCFTVAANISIDINLDFEVFSGKIKISYNLFITLESKNKLNN